MNDVWEVSEPYRTNISRRRILKKDKHLKVSLEEQANAICKKELSERYIHNAFQKFDGGYVYYDRDDAEVLSLCLWKIYGGVLHILLICSHIPEYGLGKLMLQDIEYYCFENKLDRIAVEPATDRLRGYYSHFGYIEDANDASKMFKNLVLTKINSRRKNKTRKVHMAKQEYPIIASMMPHNMNTWRNQNF